MREQRSFVLLQVQNSGDVTVTDAICRCASVVKGNCVQVFYRHQHFLLVGSACCSPL